MSAHVPTSKHCVNCMAAMRSSEELKNFCENLADAAAAEILPRFRNLDGVDNKEKAGFDPVTEADRAAEAAMRKLIAERYPEDGIDGEEFGVERAGADRVWILDPIDGTRSFIIGLPTWGVLIGMLENGRPAIGMMAQPFVNESFFGDGRQAYSRVGQTTIEIRVRACPGLVDATLLTTSPDILTAPERDLFYAISADAQLTRYGTDCYGYCLLAAGFVDIVIESGLKNQDIAPLIPIVEGAGGIVTSWTGGPATNGGRVVASGDPKLHEAMLKRLSQLG